MIPLVKHTIFMCWWLKLAVTETAGLQGNLLFTSIEHEVTFGFFRFGKQSRNSNADKNIP